MTINEYQKAAMRTASGVATATKDNLLLNGVMGMNGEAGECIDMVKKHFFQGHTLDREKLVKELGDVCWYVAITAEALGVSLEEVMQKNVDKLMKRYPDGFDPEKSVHREPEE
jgi:NTP pyrophosphatase (non-canonical NTP hydrolase)